MHQQNAKRKTVVLVTGATGCVGALLVPELLDRGYGVVATDRPGTRVPAPKPGLTWREADLTDSHQAPLLMQGVDAVIHCAAIVDISLDYARLAPINTDAVRWLYAAAAVVGVSSFVHLSSGSVYAPRSRPFVETDVVLPTSAYEHPQPDGAALWRRVVRAESIAPELAPRADMEAVVYLGGDTVFDCTRLAQTGFRFRYPTFHRGWTDTVRWYRDHGWLPAEAGNEYNQTKAA